MMQTAECVADQTTRVLSWTSTKFPRFILHSGSASFSFLMLQQCFRNHDLGLPDLVSLMDTSFNHNTCTGLDSNRA